MIKAINTCLDAGPGLLSISPACDSLLGIVSVKQKHFFSKNNNSLYILHKKGDMCSVPKQ